MRLVDGSPVNGGLSLPVYGAFSPDRGPYWPFCGRSRTGYGMVDYVGDAISRLCRCRQRFHQNVGEKRD